MSPLASGTSPLDIPVECSHSCGSWEQNNTSIRWFSLIVFSSPALSLPSSRPSMEEDDHSADTTPHNVPPLVRAVPDSMRAFMASNNIPEDAYDIPPDGASGLSRFVRLNPRRRLPPSQGAPDRQLWLSQLQTDLRAEKLAEVTWLAPWGFFRLPPATPLHDSPACAPPHNYLIIIYYLLFLLR